MEDFITIGKGGLRITLCTPGSYYRGTRFDWCGVFRRIEKDGFVYADEWFDSPDPIRHDNVCGCSEEFVVPGFDGLAPGGLFFKPGVGLLRKPDDAAYDRFRLYEIADGGAFSVNTGPCEAVFTHRVAGCYEYVKTIAVTDDSSFEIRHSLLRLGTEPLDGWSYNHNFFTFGGAATGPARRIDFPYVPAGNWRSSYDIVALENNGIRFSDGIEPPLPCVFMGDLHSAAGATPYEFRIAESGREVQVKGNAPVDHMVFWANPRVACIEPYLPLSVKPGERAEWTVAYKL